MHRSTAILIITILFAAALCSAQQPSSSGPYKVLKTAKVGGEGNWDYIYADPAGRRLYIPRRVGAPGGANAAAGAATGAPAGDQTRLTIFNLDTLEPAGVIPGVGGNGAAVDPKSGHGFTSSRPVAMFDTKTLKLIKTIDTGEAQGDGIMFDSFNQRVYVFSHPTKDATVIDSVTGNLVGKIDLGGVPEEGIADGKGKVYVVMQDPQGSVAVVDAKTMKTTTHYPFGDQGSCNGLALDTKNSILFAACRLNFPPKDPAEPSMVVLSAKDGKILAKLPLGGASDGSIFNPATMEAYSTLGNGKLSVVKEKTPTSFEVEQTLDTMNGARTIAFDPKDQHIFTMSDERMPAPPAPAGGGGRGGGRGAPIPGSFTILMIGK